MAKTSSGGEYPGGPLVLTPPLWFLWTAVAVALPLAAVLLWRAAPWLVDLRYRSGLAYALTHLVTLGWGSMTAVGSAYLMGGFLLGTRHLAGRRWFPWQFAAFAAGVLLMVAGFVRGRWLWVGPGGLLVAVTAWSFLAVMVASAASAATAAGGTGPPRPRRPLAPRVATFLAIAAFALVSAWGLVIVYGLFDARLAWLWAGNRALGVHLALGLGGWFGMLVVGVSYRLLPATHGVQPNARRAAAVVGLATGAWTLAAAGNLTPGGGMILRAAALLTAAAALLYSADMVDILMRRRRRRPDLNVAHWAAVAGYTVILGTLAGAWGLGLVPAALVERLTVTWVVMFLLGWVTQAILGQLYKVSPFLMWYYRAVIWDVTVIPRLPDVYAPRPGRLAFWTTNAGTALVAVGVAAGGEAARWVAQAGALAFAAGAFTTAWMYGYSWVPPVLAGRLRFGFRDPGLPEAADNPGR